jgi:hypothetical protein
MENPNEKNIGPTDRGEYNTPYNVTIIYNDNDLLQSAIALACSQAQLVAMPIYQPDTDLTKIPSSFVHPTPHLVILTQCDEQTLNLIAALSPMTNHIHVLAETHQSGDMPYDTFTYADLYSYINVSSSAALFALEQI